MPRRAAGSSHLKLLQELAWMGEPGKQARVLQVHMQSAS
jgi:hypothetical protein